MPEIAHGYPLRLLRNGRPHDPQFSVTEPLYFRIPPLQPNQDFLDSVSPDQIAGLPEVSVNRGKYSRPRDVIFGKPKHGIAMLLVQEVSGQIVSEGDVNYELKVEHDPLEDNYAHTEIRVYKNGERVHEKGDLSSTVRLALREIISRPSRIYKRPSMTSAERG